MEEIREREGDTLIHLREKESQKSEELEKGESKGERIKRTDICQ